MRTAALKTLAAVAIALALAGCADLFGPPYYEDITNNIVAADIGVTSVDMTETTDIERRCIVIGIALTMEADTISARQLEAVLRLIQPELGSVRPCHLGLGAVTSEGEIIDIEPAATELGLHPDDYTRNAAGFTFTEDVLNRDFGN